MRLFAFSLLAFLVSINIHVVALNYDLEVVTEEKKIDKPAVLLTRERAPIRRITIGGDAVRVNSSSTIKNKRRDSFYRKPQFADEKTERAVAYYGSRYYKISGVKARINLWKPSVNAEKAYSSSQIWIVSDQDHENHGKRNTIEVGWHVFPSYYNGDDRPILFIHWTTWRGDQELGCYNLDCPGFHQLLGVDMIGKPFETVSIDDGLQRFITIQVQRTERGNWWLQVANTQVGYWPNHIFTHLSEGAAGVHWGGETWIKNTNDDQNTVVPMGSGKFAQEGYRKASCFTDLAVTFESTDNPEFITVTPDNMALTQTSPSYTIITKNDLGGLADNSGFLYGGPGDGSFGPNP